MMRVYVFMCSEAQVTCGDGAVVGVCEGGVGMAALL